VTGAELGVHSRGGQAEGQPMRIYIFKSDANDGLRAFTGELTGSKLPDQFRPWQAVGVISPEKDPPYKLSRAEIEKAIDVHGFQLWRMKPKAKQD
jgi:hypothetical protein